MRVLFMTDTPANPDSGAAGTEYQTIASLRRLGHEVDAVWSDELPRRLKHGNLHYLLELPFTYRARMLERMRKGSFDVVHASQPHGYLAARALNQTAPRSVFIHRSHGFEPRVAAALAPWRTLQPRRPPLKRLASGAMAELLEFNHRAISRHASGHIFSSSLCADFLHDRYGVARERIAVIAQAPPPAYQALPAPAFDARRLDRFLYVGQMAFFKAPGVLAQAMAQALRARAQATATWVCSREHHAAAASLLEPAIRHRVTFLDWMPQQDLMRVYDDHGVFLLPSLFEGFGKVFLEAMARGLIVIATPEGGARDLIEDGRNGFLVPVGDARALAAACRSVQTGATDAAAIATGARETAMQYTWDRVGSETADFYTRLMEMR